MDGATRLACEAFGVVMIYRVRRARQHASCASDCQRPFSLVDVILTTLFFRGRTVGKGKERKGQAGATR